MQQHQLLSIEPAHGGLSGQSARVFVSDPDLNVDDDSGKG
jgi:hypothetical protein